jgi:hypothetical protein
MSSTPPPDAQTSMTLAALDKNAVVVADAVDVVEDQTHGPAAPELAEPAKLAGRCLQTFLVRARLRFSL